MSRKRIFITHILPRHLVARHGLSFAACNFSYNLISGGGFDCVYSLMPLFVGGRIDESAFQDGHFTLTYRQTLRRMGWIGRNIAAMKEQWKVFKQIPEDACVWFYNLTVHDVFLFLFLKFFRPSVQRNVIVLDLTPPFHMFSKNRFFLRLINAAHGCICLSHSELFKNDNMKELPGVVPSILEAFPLLQQKNNCFLLCGVMNEAISQTSMVLRAFSRMPNCELHITGLPDDVALAREWAEKCQNIHFHGMLSFDDYLQLLDSITFMLSTRNPQSPENQCNFPSKILEALLHNRAVISTMHYQQLKGIGYFVVPSDEDAFIAEIERISKMNEKGLMSYFNQSEKIYERFNVEVWNRTMEEIE